MPRGSSDCHIDATAQVDDCVLDEGASIYKCVSAAGCSLGRGSILGDFTRTADSAYGEHVRIQRNNMIYGARLGDYSYTGKNCTIWHAVIGKFCSLSWNVSIGGANHDYNRLTTHSMPYAPEFGFVEDGGALYARFDDDCVVGNDVWIGCGATICRGVHVGDGAVIGANACVTKDVEPYTIVAGVPAKPLKKRFPDNIISELLDLRWWDLPSDAIRENIDLFGAVPDEEVLTRLRALVESQRF